MYNVGEYIVHPGQGVCKVEAVETEGAPVYCLMPVHGRNAMLIRYPVAGEGRLRPVATSAEAEDLIASYPALEADGFHDRSPVLEEKHFKEVIRHGSLTDIMRTAKTFAERIESVEAGHKKAPVIYERIYKEARERSLEELECALHEDEDEVTERFRAALSC